MADLLQGIQDRLVGVLCAAGVLPVCCRQVWIVIVRVDDGLMARLDEGRRRLVDSLAGPVCILPTCELLELRNRHS